MTTARRLGGLCLLPCLLFGVGCVSGDGDAAPDDAAGATDSTLDGAFDGSVDTRLDDVRLDAPLDGRDAGPLDSATDGPVDVVADSRPVDPIVQTLVGTDVPSPRVGMFYLVWHAPAATAMHSVVAKGGTPLTLEDVIRGNGTPAYGDILKKWGLEGEAMSFYWMSHPKLGFYCIYRARAGETGYVPDCPDITTTLSTHAAQLVAAGVDYVVLDETNLSGTDRASDLLQLRPTEVLFEEWAKLRAAGKKTPQIAVWNAIPSGATQWKGHLALYDNPAYDGLVMHDKKTGKKVFFVVDPPDSGRFPDAAIMSSITSNGGKNDVEIQKMWTLDKTDASLDRWAFMSYCTDPPGSGKFTTNIVGEGACAQPTTPKSTLGSVVAVAPSFQTGYGSLPFGSAGKLSGLTLARQFATAFEKRPDYLFISGWNEFIAQPQPNPFGSDPFAKSVGLERDPDGRSLFVDTFGVELGRDIEPTVEQGSFYYDLAASCVRVFRANAKTGATTCSDPKEACCTTATADVYRNVWSLTHAGLHDLLLTTSATEKSAVVASGYREVCSRYGSPTLFCLRGDDPDSPMAPFLAFAAAGAGRKPLYRCLTGGTHHFYTLDSKCEGQTVEAVVAYFADAPTSEMPRRASRCYNAGNGMHFLAIGSACPSGVTDEGVLGYVR